MNNHTASLKISEIVFSFSLRYATIVISYGNIDISQLCPMKFRRYYDLKNTPHFSRKSYWCIFLQ